MKKKINLQQKKYYIFRGESLYGPYTSFIRNIIAPNPEEALMQYIDGYCFDSDFTSKYNIHILKIKEKKYSVVYKPKKVAKASSFGFAAVQQDCEGEYFIILTKKPGLLFKIITSLVFLKNHTLGFGNEIKYFFERGFYRTQHILKMDFENHDDESKEEANF